MVEKNKEICLKVNSELYNNYKKALKKTFGIVPAVDIKTHMKDIVEKYDVEDTFEITEHSGNCFVTANIHTNITNNYKLPYEGEQAERMKELAMSILTYNPTAILINEFMPGPKKGDDIVYILQNRGYELFYPEGYNREKDLRKWCITVLAVRSDACFTQRFISSNLNYRYISGSLETTGGTIEILGLHIPAVYDSSNSRQVERKLEIYKVANEFTNGLKDGCKAILLGDFNSDTNSICADSLDGLLEYWDDIMEKTPTWNDSRLDYILANSALVKECEVTTLVSDKELKKGLTDHKVLISIFS